MNYLLLKSLHIVFVVCWFSALFYVVRLFIYHKEAEEKDNSHRLIIQNQLVIMAKKLTYIILWPSCIISFFFGCYMIVNNINIVYFPWMQVKLSVVFLLMTYTVYTQIILNSMVRGTINISAIKLRLWNEIATIFLILITILAVMKNSISWPVLIFSICFFSILMIVMIFIYNKK